MKQLSFARHACFLSMAVATCFFTGCGEGTPTGDVIDTVEAGGVLTYKGQPLEYHQVTLFPTDNRPAVGTTDAEGKFTLGTNGAGDGAVPGTHKVAVIYVGPPSTNPEEGITEFTQPPPPKVKIDKKYQDTETSGVTVEVPEDGSTELKIELK